MDRFACDWHRLSTTDPKISTFFIICPKNRKSKFIFTIINENKKKTRDFYMPYFIFLREQYQKIRISLDKEGKSGYHSLELNTLSRVTEGWAR